MATNRSNTSKSNTRKTGNSSRNTNNRKKSTGNRSRNYNSSGRREVEPLDDSLKKEIMLILIVAVCIIIFLCNITKSADENLMGTFGSFVKSVMFGLFGFVSYVLPIGAVIFTLFRVFNPDNPIVTRKLISATVLVLMFMMICDMATGLVGKADKLDIAEIYKRCSTDFKGGGVIGGSLAYLINHFLGDAGTWMLIIVLSLICVIVITGKSLLSGIKEQGQQLYDESREDRDARREYKEERRRERKAEIADLNRERRKAKQEKAREKARRRMEENQQRDDGSVLGGKYDDPVKGVSADTTLKRTDDIEEQIAKSADDRHFISVTDETDYRKKLTDSVVTHINTISEGSDVTREITPEFVADYDDYEPEINISGRTANHIIEVTPEVLDDTEEDNYERFTDSSEPTVVTSSEGTERERRDAETTYQAPVRMNGITIGADPAAYGEGGAKPDASYTTEYGNTMGRTGNTRRVSATKADDSSASSSKSGTGSTIDTSAKASSRASYRFPSPRLLTEGKRTNGDSGAQEWKTTSAKLQETLRTFGVNVTMTDICRGPSVTRYEMQPELGVKVSKIVGLQDDIKLSLAAVDIRIEAPIPGKSAIGIEVPNKVTEAVAFRDLIESKEFKNSTAALPFAVGKDIAGSIIVHDIAKMPHVLIAGATGSGKSVCINTIIMSILFKCHPDDVRLLMVDPKVVELSVYNQIPHLVKDVVTDPREASAALKWAVYEMDRRYNLFAEAKVRDLKGYNDSVKGNREAYLPHLLIIVDELADLMMVAPGEVEESICRLAQKARACGIHLVLATQRPSVDVITGLIKANMPSRVAFAVSSGTDSRTILDMNGAEKLLGKGDMLFYPQGLPKPSRIQGAFIPDSDVNQVVDFLRAQQYVPGTQRDAAEKLTNVQQNDGNASESGGASSGNDSEYDELFAKAGRFIIDKDKASIGALQRLLKIGFNRAARIMDQLAEAGVVGEEQGTKPREILMDAPQFEILLEDLGIN